MTATAIRNATIAAIQESPRISSTILVILYATFPVVITQTRMRLTPSQLLVIRLVITAHSPETLLILILRYAANTARYASPVLVRICLTPTIIPAIRAVTCAIRQIRMPPIHIRTPAMQTVITAQSLE